MKKTFGILILISIIVGADCANSKDARAENRIVVLTYNVHHGEGVDQQFDLERIAEVINSVSPDIVSLQEVDNKTTRSKGIDQAKELARLTNMTSVYGSSMDYAGGKYGNAVLTKLPIEGSKTIPLPGEPRSALCVTLTTSGKHSPAARFLFVATHLDAQPRFNYVALIEKLFDSDKDLPAILAGDLNAIPRSPTMQEFNKTWQNATSQKGLYTVPVNNPSKQIDYILCRPPERWRTVETKVINETVASDHRPILAVLEFLPELKKKTKTISPNKPDADDSPAPQSSLSKQIADHVERVGKNDQLLLRDLPKFRQDLIQSIESGWEPPFVDNKNVKSRADYEKLSTPALAKECFKTALWARLMLIYERPACGIVRAGVVHNGFAVLYRREDFWDGIAAVYEDLARKLPKAKVERERMDILFTLQELGSALTYPPFREKLRGREETLLRANVVALKAVLGYTEEAKQQPKKPFWGAGVAYGLSCNVFALLKETNPEKYSQLLEQLKGIDLSFREPEPSQVEAYIQLLVSEADQSTATEESKSEHTGTRIAEPDAVANAGKSRR